jgi:hypothetical protein
MDCIDSNCDGCVNIPYTVDLKQVGDFLKLEKILRHQLQCQGSSCSFLQSAEYAAVKIAAMHAWQGRGLVDIAVPQIICIPNSSLMLHVMDSHTTIIIREQLFSTCGKETSKKKKRKSPGEICDRESVVDTHEDCEVEVAADKDLNVKKVEALEKMFVTARAKR